MPSAGGREGKGFPLLRCSSNSCGGVDSLGLCLVRFWWKARSRACSIGFNGVRTEAVEDWLGDRASFCLSSDILSNLADMFSDIMEAVTLACSVACLSNSVDLRIQT